VPGIILDDHVRDGLPQIPQEPLRDFEAPDHAPGHRGEKRQGVVPAPRLELIAHPGCPVLRPVLPAVNVSGDQHLACRGAGVGDEFAHHAGEVRLDALLAQLVAFEAAAAFGRRGVLHARARVAEPQHRPFAGGHVPHEMPALIHRAAQVDNGRAVDHHLQRETGLHNRRRHEARLIASLDLDVFNAVRAGRWEREHLDIPIETRDRFRLLEHTVKMLRPFEVCLAPHDLLHGLFGRDPRPAAAVPPRVVVHVDLEPEPLRLRDYVFEQCPPRVAHERHRPGRDTLVHLHDQHPADAHAFHRL